jgi:hypothetical protein
MAQAQPVLEFRMVVTRTELVEAGDNASARVHLSEYGRDLEAGVDVVVTGKENIARFVVGELFSLHLMPHERR